MIEDSTTASVLHQMNARFAAGDSVTEMVALHRHFGVFKPTISLKDSFNLLNIAPDHPKERARWFHFLDHDLKGYPSDKEGVNGHDRVIMAYEDNLNNPHPLPVHTTTHSMDHDNRVLVKEAEPPISYKRGKHVVISIPVRPR